ncbi:twin-arginine translocation signal domain-containing protein, partial [Candidatus Acetothermia bacterium]|nr:twin-arginine translocation signal domain-containing protein [Candidatus Acetothermia bacterium]
MSKFENKKKNSSRRQFLQTTAATAIGVGILGASQPVESKAQYTPQKPESDYTLPRTAFPIGVLPKPPSAVQAPSSLPAAAGVLLDLATINPSCYLETEEDKSQDKTDDLQFKPTGGHRVDALGEQLRQLTEAGL